MTGLKPVSAGPNVLTALDAAARIKDGSLTSEQLVAACIDQIEETDPDVLAWKWRDSEASLEEARELDRLRRFGKPLGALHGVPVGVKDIIDTEGVPTERGTPLFAGRIPSRNAFLVDRLRDAGTVMLGKTVTTELAFMNPAETRNPHDASRSPGGSSSGSAASVAHFQVPAAIGSQTNGSVIRPASFCGVFGFKPTRGTISTKGVLETCPNLDQVGVFGRTLEDVAALADAISGYDSRDIKSHPRPKPRILDGCRSEVPVEPVFAWFEPGYFGRLADDVRQGLEDVLALLGKQVERIPVPDGFDDLVEVHRRIMEFELFTSLGTSVFDNRGIISSAMLQAVDRGSKVTENEYRDALAAKARAEQYFNLFFRDYDAIIAPSAAGEAPPAEQGTGDPVFCTVWTLCGLPALNVPILSGAAGLPVGLQLIAGRDEDDRLLRTARWLIAALFEDEGS